MPRDTGGRLFQANRGSVTQFSAGAFRGRRSALRRFPTGEQ
jgi:hypothetical protein